MRRLAERSRILKWWLAALWLLAMPVLAPAASPQQVRKLVKALGSKSFKVRLQAAILIGKKKITRAAGALRRALGDEHDAVRAAAALSLGKLGDQQARPGVVRLLGEENSLLVRSAEKSLLLLDRARGEPAYLVALAKPIAKGAPARLGARLDRLLRRQLARTGGLVLSAGEERVLSGRRLSEHLGRRRLTGMMLQPRIAEYSRREQEGNTVVEGKIDVLVYTLVRRRMEFSASGEANAWLEGTDLGADEVAELETAVLQSAATAAVEQVVEYLSSRQP